MGPLSTMENAESLYKEKAARFVGIEHGRHSRVDTPLQWGRGRQTVRRRGVHVPTPMTRMTATNTTLQEAASQFGIPQHTDHRLNKVSLLFLYCKDTSWLDMHSTLKFLSLKPQKAIMVLNSMQQLLPQHETE